MFEANNKQYNKRDVERKARFLGHMSWRSMSKTLCIMYYKENEFSWGTFEKLKTLYFKSWKYNVLCNSYVTVQIE